MKKLLIVLVIIESLILFNFVIKENIHASQKIKIKNNILLKGENQFTDQRKQIINNESKYSFLLKNTHYKNLLFICIIFLLVLSVLNLLMTYIKVISSKERILLNVIVSLVFVIMFYQQFLALFKSFPFILPAIIGVFILSQIFYGKKAEEYSKKKELKIDPEFSKNYNISNREEEIISLILKEMSNDQISKKLYISLSTVKNHISNIYKKTGVKRRKEIIYLLNA